MLQNATVKTKLTVGVGIVVVSMLVGTIYSAIVIRGLTSVVTRASRIYQLGRLAESSSNMIGLSRAIVLHSIFDDKQKVEVFRKQFASSSQVFSDMLNAANSSSESDSDKAAVDNLRSKQAEWQALHNEVMGLLSSQRVDVAETKVADQDFIAKADEIRRLADDMAASEATALSTQASVANIKSLIGSVILVAVSAGLGLFVLAYVRRISDELSQLTASLAHNSGQLADLSATVRETSETLAKVSSQQSASLEETAASTEQITAMTHKNAANSKTAASVMSGVAGHVTASNRTLELMTLSMRDINESSSKISRIIKVIDEIAFQTNILALNAAVEAARAGEAGAGFAVVADEVRSLAQRSAQAASDTAELIEESIAKSQDGSMKLKQVTEGISAITAGALKMNVLVDEVSTASQEQVRGIDHIAKTIAHMDQGTQSAAASAEQGAASSIKLLAQAEDLHTIVMQLRSLVGCEV